jgi:hypothetical protein
VNQEDDLTRHKVAWQRDRNFLRGCASLSVFPVAFFAIAAIFGDLPAFWTAVLLVLSGLLSFGLVHLLICPRCGRKLQWRGRGGNAVGLHCQYCASAARIDPD